MLSSAEIPKMAARKGKNSRRRFPSQISRFNLATTKSAIIWPSPGRFRVERTLHSLLSMCLLSVLFLEVTRAFNIAPKASYLASLPQKGSSDQSSYFGYSVGLLQAGSFRWLLVGAPRANSSASPGVFEPGTFFKCPLHFPTRPCEEVIVDSTPPNGRHKEATKKLFRNSSWVGGAIDIDVENNVIVCAPRLKFVWEREFRISGACYLLGKELESDSAFLLAPLLKHDYQVYGKDSPVYFYAHGQGGFDIHITDNEILLLGAPGVLSWQGSIVREFYESRVPAEAMSKREASRIYQVQAIPNLRRTTEIQDNNYFGYAVSSGKFGDGEKIFYVGSAPRAAELHGMVLVYKDRFLEDQPLYIKHQRQGTQLGEYFGASVAAPDLNGDGMSDLVAGAPMHSFEGVYDAGCVYVFISIQGRKETLSTDPIMLLGDAQPGARFGTAIGTPGDLDNDGYEDLLVGAPFEDEMKGTVYVFMGTTNGIRKDYSQKLLPEEVSSISTLKGFGISFSRPEDLDGNYYPDLAVGSFLSDEAVVMFTRPVIGVSGRLSAHPAKLRLTHDRFTLTSCLSYRGNRIPTIPPRAEFVAQIELRQESLSGDVLSSFRSNGHTKTEIAFDVEAATVQCKDLPVELKPEKSDAQKPISVKMSFRLKNNDERKPDDPIISLYNPLPPILLLSFITGCREDICRSDLVTFAKFVGFDDYGKLVVGELTKIVLEVDVGNKGEPAFLPNATILISHPVVVLPSLDDCEIKHHSNYTEVVCQLRNPLNREKDSLSFDLDVTRIDDTSPDINVRVYANSAAESEVNPTDNLYSLQLQLEKRASVKVTGWSEPEQFTFKRSSNTQMRTNGTYHIKHIFSVEKTDESPVREVSVQIAIPDKFFTKEGEALSVVENLESKAIFGDKFLPCQIKAKPSDEMILSDKMIRQSRLVVYGSVESLNCSVGNILCSYILCNTGPWKKGYGVSTITVLFNLNFTILGEFVSVERGFSLISLAQVQISSSGEIIGKRYASDRVETLFNPGGLPAKTLAWWIYFLAIIGGLLLLLLIAYILYKVGFFKRKDKEKLQSHQAALTRIADDD